LFPHLKKESFMVTDKLNRSVVFKSQATLRRSLMLVKSKIPEERKREVVYKVPCKDCNSVYVGETKRNLKTRLSEHRYAVSRGDDKNGISVRANTLNHSIAWECASVEKVVNGYWKRRMSEAILIGKAEKTMNLDCGLHLP